MRISDWSSDVCSSDLVVVERGMSGPARVGGGPDGGVYVTQPRGWERIMTETLFSLDKRNFRECQQMFRGTRDQEYYRGDFWIEEASNMDVRSERKTVGESSIIKQRSAANLFFQIGRG